MLRPLAILSALFILASPVHAAPRRHSVPHPTEFTAVDLIARDAIAGGIPGISVAILRGDEAIFAKAYGVESLTTKVPVKTSTVFEIGSVTKQFTAAAIMRLVEQGKLRLDEKAGTFVTELDAKFATVTIEHLLTHTSGIPEYNDLLTSAYVAKSQSEMMVLINQRARLFAPGTAWSYSNSNYYLLGMILERLSADTYPHLMRQNFFLPLGLTSTDYCQAPLRAGYWRQSGVTDVVQPADMSLAFAAGAICSTATDLARWNHALVTGHAVTTSSYARMTTSYRLINGTKTNYGYGLVVDTLDGRPRVWHNGAIIGYMTNLAWYPDSDLTVAVLVNLLDLNGRDLGTEISDQIARALK